MFTLKTTPVSLEFLSALKSTVSYFVKCGKVFQLFSLPPQTKCWRGRYMIWDLGKALVKHCRCNFKTTNTFEVSTDSVWHYHGSTQGSCLLGTDVGWSLVKIHLDVSKPRYSLYIELITLMTAAPDVGCEQCFEIPPLPKFTTTSTVLASLFCHRGRGLSCRGSCCPPLFPLLFHTGTCCITALTKVSFTQQPVVVSSWFQDSSNNLP